MVDLTVSSPAMKSLVWFSATLITILIPLLHMVPKTTAVKCYQCQSAHNAHCRDPFAFSATDYSFMKDDCHYCLKWFFRQKVIRACGTADVAPHAADRYLEMPASDGHHVQLLLNFDWLAASSKNGTCAEHDNRDDSMTCICNDSDLCNTAMVPRVASLWTAMACMTATLLLVIRTVTI